MRRMVLLGVALVAASAGIVYAQECLDTRGLDGRELTVIAFSQMDSDALFVGTEDGLFAKDVKGHVSFRRVRGMPHENCRVNAIRPGVLQPEVLAATDRGLFAVNVYSLKARCLFSRSDSDERACFDVVRLADGALIVTTRAGVFSQQPAEAEWVRLPVPFDESLPARLLGVGSVVYAASQDGVYRYAAAQDGGYRSAVRGRSWEKVFDAASPAYESDASSAEDEDASEDKRTIVVIAGLEGEPERLCLATTFGIFHSQDAGRTWRTLPLSGLDYASVRDIIIHPVLQELLCLTRSGLYVWKGEDWVQLAPVFEGRSMTGFGTDVVYASRTGIYVFDPLMRTGIAGMAAADIRAAAFRNEPTIEEVQRMAIEYAEVSNEKIRDWRRRASIRAFLPDFSMGYDKTVYGSSSGSFAVGPRDWGVSLEWELGDLIYNEHQTSIDTRSKLMVQLRNDILAEVTRLYFERRRLQVERTMGGWEGKEHFEKELRLQELAALINRLTGGGFENVLKSFN